MDCGIIDQNKRKKTIKSSLITKHKAMRTKPEIRNLEHFQQYLKSRAYNLEARPPSPQGKVKVNVRFIVNGKEHVIAKDSLRSTLGNIVFLARKRKPDIIIVELVVDDYTDFNEYEVRKSDLYSNRNKQPVRSHQSRNVMDDSAITSDERFQVLLEKRLEEERKERHVESIEKELTEAKNEIEKRKRQIKKRDNLLKLKQSEIDEKNKDIEEYKKILKQKESVRYYAAIAGDVLESIGIKKEDLSKPLAGFLTSDAEDAQAEQPEQREQDDSGIVDETTDSEGKDGESASSLTQEEIRKQIVVNLNNYLSIVDIRILQHLYLIFMYVERNQGLTPYIIKCIEVKVKEKGGEILT